LNQIDYIIIDEFQDFNKLQLNILREINKIRPRSFLFLGDPDQNIYQFRSAKQSNIEVFIKELKPNSYMIKETRRLSEPLLKLAKEFIKLNNSRR
jgi:DNA helicase-2/ATP-dependent DNA helicase PcrA